MEEAENRQAGAQMDRRYKLSWLAYIQPTIIFLLLLLLAWLAVQQWVMLDVSAAIVVLALALLVYQVLYRRSVVLYTDDTGVWCYSGILPWAKGSVGVKWRDLEGASFYTGFVSWACNSYTVRVGNRFTQSSELFLKHISRGKDAVQHINTRHLTMLANEQSGGVYTERGASENPR